MQIDLAALKRIAKAVPELTIAQFVAVWVEKLDEQKRERDRERHRKPTEMKAENERKQDGKPRSREEQEGDLFALARQVCGKNAGGMVTILLKQNNYDLAAVTAIFERAKATDDPKGFVAGRIKTNGKSGTGVMAALDDLIDRAGSPAVDSDAEMVDVTPRGAQGH
jgi:hypothetical protein